nr:hypothetical protein [Tanacetum cinerariifolium]
LSPDLGSNKWYQSLVALDLGVIRFLTFSVSAGAPIFAASSIPAATPIAAGILIPAGDFVPAGHISFLLVVSHSLWYMTVTAG